MKSPIGFLILGVGATFGLGCTSLLPAPAFPSDGEAQAVAAQSAPGMDEEPERPMTLYPGDVISVRTVSNDSNVYEGLVIDETGRIHLPLAGDVVVGGQSLTDAEHRIEEGLRQFDRFVRASITITEPAGHRATVLGAVQTPGEVRVAPGARIGDVIALAGGPLTNVNERGEHADLADTAAGRVYRAGEPLPVNVAQALQGDPRHNVRVRPGDHIYIPALRGEDVAVLGRVGAPGEVRYRRGLRLTQALAMAGGTTEIADEADVRILRGASDNPTVYEADLLAIVDGDSHDVVLAPGDVIFVTEEWTATTGEVLDRIFGSVFTAAGLGLTTALLIETVNANADAAAAGGALIR